MFNFNNFFIISMFSYNNLLVDLTKAFDCLIETNLNRDENILRYYLKSHFELFFPYFIFCKCKYN